MARLTPNWTATSAGAFGETGVKGDAGEQWLAQVLKSWGWEAYLHSDSRGHQIAGIDISFRSPGWNKYYTADVKTNLKNNGEFYIDVRPDGWLYSRRKKSHRIWHVNTSTGWMAWYDRRSMQDYIKTIPGEGELYAMHLREVPKFVSVRKA